MSKENHPNFHAVNFATAILKAYYESLRGKANKDNCPNINEQLQGFVMEIEELVDDKVDPPMKNMAMWNKLINNEAIDIQESRKNEDGDYVLGNGDAKEEVWIWSIGRNKKTGEVLASTAADFYRNPDFECLWLR